MWRNTRLTKQLGIPYPIIQAPMAGGATTPELIAAVSNAGGLGSLGAGYMSATDITHAIRSIRKLTQLPFAVNLFIPEEHHTSVQQIQSAYTVLTECTQDLDIEIKPVLPPYAQSFEEQIQVVYEAKVPVFSFTFGLLDAQWVELLKSNYTYLIGTATNFAEAKALETLGIDAIVLQAREAGGHRGTFIGAAQDSLYSLSDLIHQCKSQLSLPMITAGGIMNGQDIISNLALGADAVQLGTAFLSCSESGIHPQYKQTLLAQSEDNTTLTKAFSGKFARGISNQFTMCMQDKQNMILDYPIQNKLTREIRNKANETDNPEFMSLWAGTRAALCRDVSATELMHNLIEECDAAHQPKS